MVLSAVYFALQMLETFLLRWSIASSNVIVNNLIAMREVETKGFRCPDFTIHMTHIRLVSSTSSSSSLLRSASISIADRDSESIAAGISAFPLPFAKPDIRNYSRSRRFLLVDARVFAALARSFLGETTLGPGFVTRRGLTTEELEITGTSSSPSFFGILCTLRDGSLSIGNERKMKK